MSRDNASLLDIVQVCSNLASFVDGRSTEDLEENEMLYSAILYQIIVLGEASRRLSSETRALDSDSHFRNAIALRNVVVHGYDGLRLSTIWTTVMVSVPKLQTLATELLNRTTNAAEPTAES